MPAFRKAKAEQAALKIGLYGPPGSGKTFTALLIAEGLAGLSKKRVAFVDTERGTDFYCQTVKTRAVHPNAFDFDAIYSRSITEVLAGCRSLNPDEYGVIIIDSISHIWEAAMAAYGGKLTKIGTIPMHAWGKIKKPYKDLMAWLLSTPIHMIICGRQKTVFEEDEETEELKAVGVTMRAEGETPYEPHILIRMEAIRPKHTNEVADVIAYAEKDRTGVLSGRSFVNPTFDSLCRPLLGLLGTKQAQMATLDQTAGLDAETLAQQEKEKSEQSQSIYRTFSAMIQLAKTAKELKIIGQEINPQLKAQMLPEDVANLREAYLSRQDELGEPVPEEKKAKGKKLVAPNKPLTEEQNAKLDRQLVEKDLGIQDADAFDPTLKTPVLRSGPSVHTDYSQPERD